MQFFFFDCLIVIEILATLCAGWAIIHEDRVKAWERRAWWRFKRALKKALRCVFARYL